MTSARCAAGRELTVRPATAEDAIAIANVHVQAWQWAYQGLLPRFVLEAMPTERRAAVWHETLLSRRDSGCSVWVAVCADRIVGFTVTGAPQQKGYTSDTAEVQAIYQVAEVARTGVARTMLVRALNDLRTREFRVAILWVLDVNARARHFYERGGWRADGGTRSDAVGRFVFRQVRYAIDLTGDEAAADEGRCRNGSGSLDTES
jgi:L-amino acid N-acyltransferase YncA